MKLISSFMDDITLNDGECHTITFRDTTMLANFRELMQNYFSNRGQNEHNFIKILDESGHHITGRNFYFIQFDCNQINLTNDKATEKQLRDILYHYLEHHPDLVQDYLTFTNKLDNFLNGIEFVSDQLKIDFSPTDKTLLQLIRSLEIHIEYNGDNRIPNFVLRNFLIKALLDMNVLDKEVILLISYPEADIGLGDFTKAVNLIKSFNITTIIISSHSHILTKVRPENMFLIKENGLLYDVLGLRNELLKFKIVENKEVANVQANKLAYKDFNADYCLLKKNIKEFLLSSKL